eukprot:symbB.v1.2.038047.t1/scaffold5754.1/size23954/3
MNRPSTSHAEQPRNDATSADNPGCADGDHRQLLTEIVTITGSHGFKALADLGYTTEPDCFLLRYFTAEYKSDLKLEFYYSGGALIFGAKTCSDQVPQHLMVLRNIACWTHFVTDSLSFESSCMPTMFAQKIYVDDQPKICFLPLEGMSILEHPVADAMASFLSSMAVLRIPPEKFQSIVEGLAAETTM